MIPCISIDWLQLHISLKNQPIFEGDLSPSGLFKLVKKDIRHNVFNSHREIYSNLSGEWEPCAVLSYEPLSHILPATSGHIKIINKFLYHSDLPRLVDTLLRELQLTFKSVSRYDLSCDFKQFANNMSVPAFFRRVLYKKILKRHCTSIHIDGKLTKSFPIHYMRFGSNSSQVQFYIYNKSKELREKTDKPYIKEKWEKCNLNHKAYDIWRLEFVLHPSQFGIIKTDTGETIEFNNQNITDNDFIFHLFNALMFNYAAFVVNDGQQRKERMKKVQLFKWSKSEDLYLRITEKKTSNRMDKVFVKRLYQLNKAWREHNKDPIDVDSLLTQYIDERNLHDWFENKFTTLQIINDGTFTEQKIQRSYNTQERSDS